MQYNTIPPQQSPLTIRTLQATENDTLQQVFAESILKESLGLHIHLSNW